MDRLIEIETFLRIAEEGSLAGAARKLHRTPSSVSKILKNLEERLGTWLVTRSTRSLALTEAGEQFYARCRSVVSDIEEAEDLVHQMHSQPGGHLRVIGMNVLSQDLLMPLITQFMQANPGITVDLSQVERMPDLTRAAADVVLRIGQVTTKGLICERLVESHRVICAAPSYLERHGRPEKFEDLAEHNCLVFSHNPALNVWQTERGGQLVSIEPRGDLTSNSGELLRQAVLAGQGIAQLSDVLVGPDLRAGRLVALLPEQLGWTTNHVCAIYPRRRQAPHKVTAFISYLREAFTPVPPWYVDPADFTKSAPLHR